MESKGIHHDLAVPYSPEQNDVAEWMNRTLLESAQSMMVHAGLQDKFWAEPVECAAYNRNRTPTSAIKGNKTPCEVWRAKKPDISHFKVFGCMVYAHVPDDILEREEQAKPLQRRQSQCIRRPPLRYGIDECVGPAVDSIQHYAYSAFQIVNLTQWKKHWRVIAQRSGSKQPMMSIPH